MKQRKDGRWVKSTTINSKRVYFYSTAKTERQAERDIIRQITEYSEKEEKGKTFEEIANEWEREHLPKLEYQTGKSYEPLKDYAIEYFDGMYIKDIDAGEINRFIEFRAKKGFCQKTIKNQMSVLNLIFKYAYLQRYIDSNPCQYVSIPSNLTKSKRKIPTANEIKLVEENINCTFGLLAYFLLYTGLRKGEALALQWKDIDFKTNIIHVTKSIYHEGNVGHFKQPKTEAGVRDVILLDCLKKKLKKGSPNELVFPGNDGSIMRKSTFKHRWTRYQTEVGISITPHQLRHAFASYILFDAGIDVKTAQSMLGHADVTTTQNIYTQITDEHKTATANVLNEFINNGRRVVKFRKNGLNAV